MERGRPERPLDDASGPVGDLAASLRELRAVAGNPSYRTMAATAHFSPATLARAAAGHRLPSLEVVVAYATACGGDREEWEQRWRDCSEKVARARAEGRAVSSLPDHDAENGQLPQSERLSPGGRGPARRRWRTRQSAVALAGLTLAATAVLFGIRAISDTPSHPGLASVPTTAPNATAPYPPVPNTEDPSTSDPNAPNTQQPGRACNQTGHIADVPATPRSSQSQTRASFEGNFQVGSRWGQWWDPQWQMESLATSQAYQGSQSLRVQVTGPYTAIGTKHIAGLAPGDKVTVHIWYGGQGAGYICPVIQDPAFDEWWIPQAPLVLKPSDRPGWRTYSWTMPTDIVLLGTGFQLNRTSKQDLVILLDDVTW